jgi:hypothetical protein
MKIAISCRHPLHTQGDTAANTSPVYMGWFDGNSDSLTRGARQSFAADPRTSSLCPQDLCILEVIREEIWRATRVMQETAWL